MKFTDKNIPSPSGGRLGGGVMLRMAATLNPSPPPDQVRGKLWASRSLIPDPSPPSLRPPPPRAGGEGGAACPPSPGGGGGGGGKRRGGARSPSPPGGEGGE